MSATGDSGKSNERAPSDSQVAAALARAMDGEAVKPEVASAYLFGSVAETRAHRESDVDLGVLLAWTSHATRGERFEVGIRLAGSVQAELAQGRIVDLVVLNDAPPLLGRHIVTRGRKILCCDARIDHAYVRDVQLRAADLEPWLRRMRAVKLRTLRP